MVPICNVGLTAGGTSIHRLFVFHRFCEQGMKQRYSRVALTGFWRRDLREQTLKTSATSFLLQKGNNTMSLEKTFKIKMILVFIVL